MVNTRNDNQGFQPLLGLALSGSGNRTAFYIGFLEVLEEAKLPIGYIAASSGGSLAAAAYACGTLSEFKQRVMSLDQDSLKTYFVKNNDKGGLYSSELLEEEVRRFTKGLNFEEVRPLMGFVAVDIESGDKVLLSMGDIARAAVISCTLPGVFKPVKWGGKTLVDGGLLTMVPGDFLRLAGMDVTVGVNMRGTRHIFTDRQITLKRIYNLFKKVLLVDEIESLVGDWFKLGGEDFIKNRGFFEVIGRSLDLAIEANKRNDAETEACDLMIVPNLPRLKQNQFSPESNKYYCERGRQAALENLDKIWNLLKIKQAEKELT